MADDTEPRSRFRILPYLFYSLLILFYPLSIGPAFRWEESKGTPFYYCTSVTGNVDWIDLWYALVFWIVFSFPEGEELLKAYVGLWL